ncbi:hypothetical protein DFH29DRAFT_522731 [Suillus ampliporus]|nr:hypothetical protein DFH29DRAFT_522731 [Suillus ampliporus]
MLGFGACLEARSILSLLIYLPTHRNMCELKYMIQQIGDWNGHLKVFPPHIVLWKVKPGVDLSLQPAETLADRVISLDKLSGFVDELFVANEVSEKLNDIDSTSLHRKPDIYHEEAFQFNEESTWYTAINLEGHAEALQSLGFSVENQPVVRREYKDISPEQSTTVALPLITCLSRGSPESVSIAVSFHPHLPLTEVSSETLFLMFVILDRMLLSLPTALHIVANAYFLIHNGSVSVHGEYDQIADEKYPGIEVYLTQTTP